MTYFVDLFCGAGGLSVGFENAGGKPVFANDLDEHATASFSENHPDVAVFTGDVAELTARKILGASGVDSVDLVIGGPNCQGVSLRGKRNPKDPKNEMFFHYSRLIGDLKPSWFVMENVPGLMHRHNRQLLTDIFEVFHDLGYRCGADVLLAADYGVPQLRYRVVLVGNRHGERVAFPEPTHGPDLIDYEDLFATSAKKRHSWLTVAEAIGDLPAIANGGGCEVADYPSNSSHNLSDYQRTMRRGSRMLYNHVAHKTAPNNISLIKHIPPGGNWRNIPETLRPARFAHVALKDHTTTYGRLRWDKPSRTITTYFNNISAGAFTHPAQDRGISVREGARLQSFPDRFKFVGPLSKQYRQIGNAVPPLMAEAVARSVLQAMRGDVQPASRIAAIEYDHRNKAVVINRPIQGMRFNLDKHLVVR